VSKINQNNGLVSNYVRGIVKNGASYCMTTARGVTLMQDRKFKTLSTTDGLPHNYCFYAQADQKGRIWVSTEGGVGIYDKNAFQTITQENGLLSNRIKYILPQTDGSMLLLSDYGIDLARDGEIKRFIHKGLKDKEVLNTVIRDNSGNFWIGSDINGLIFYDTDTKRIRYLNQVTHLPFTRARAMVFDQEQMLCVGTERGIYYLEVTPKGDIISISSAGVDKGYPDFEVNQNAVLLAGDDIYFGTSIGAVIFNPTSIRNQPSVPIAITDLMIEFRNTDWENIKVTLNPWFGTPVNPVLSYDQNDIQINYKGISLKSSEKLWYRYQLSQYDQSWSQPVQGESVMYANLNPGRYHFKVAASYDGLQWTDAYTQYDFVIAPPFWKTWWFYIIVLSFLLVGFVLVNNYRIKARINQLLLIEKINKEEYEKIQKKVAMDFHDEIGNHLTSISLLVDLIKNRKWNVPSELQNFLDKIDTESKQLFHGSKDFIWSIDPKNNNLKEVFYKIKDYGEEIFDNTGIQFHVNNGATQNIDVILPAGFTRQILLIFKEAINNIRQHAGTTDVQFSVSMNPENFIVKLSDNGRGFQWEEKDYYHGLKKMKLRGGKVKGDLVFNSDPERGTEIMLKADLNKNMTN
jgi:signal transduction histidine kinase